MNIGTLSSTRVQVKDSTKVNKTGDIMSGFLILCLKYFRDYLIK